MFRAVLRGFARNPRVGMAGLALAVALGLALFLVLHGGQPMGLLPWSAEAHAAPAVVATPEQESTADTAMQEFALQAQEIGGAKNVKFQRYAEYKFADGQVEIVYAVQGDTLDGQHHELTYTVHVDKDGNATGPD